MDPADERLVQLIADTCNRAILTILNDAAQPLSLHELANRLHAYDGPGCSDIIERGGQEELQMMLHHTHLPRLSEAGLIDYDPDNHIITYESFPAVDVETQEMEMVDELLSCFTTGTDLEANTIGMLEGREDVIKYGRYLADEADEELFCMYTSTDLLEDGCLQHAQDAIDRDVEILLGTTNSEVRELAHEQLPEVTIWEPQLDWMNAPTEYPKLSRLVLADREQVMLALLKDPDTTDYPPEIAVIGEGQENPLVVLVRELLGPRLDHLDYQSEEFLDDLPFEP